MTLISCGKNSCIKCRKCRSCYRPRLKHEETWSSHPCDSAKGEASSDPNKLYKVPLPCPYQLPIRSSCIPYDIYLKYWRFHFLGIVGSKDATSCMQSAGSTWSSCFDKVMWCSATKAAQMFASQHGMDGLIGNLDAELMISTPCPNGTWQCLRKLSQNLGLTFGQ